VWEHVPKPETIVVNFGRNYPNCAGGKHRAVSLFFLAALLAMFSRSAWSAESVPVGTVTNVSGKVALERGGQGLTPSLKSDVLLYDRFITEPSSSITRLEVGPSSSIRIDQHMLNSEKGDRSTVIGLLTGTIHSIVPFAANHNASFVVRTGNAICGVRDTEFETSYIEGKPCPGFPDCKRYTDVGVYRGVVEVRSTTNPKARPVRVSAGYETTVPCEIPPSAPSPLGATELEAPGYH
jgi:FecR protein